MNKPRQMGTLLALILGLGILSVGVFWENNAYPAEFVGGDRIELVIESLNATLYGNGTLVETYTYRVTGSGIKTIPVVLPYRGEIAVMGQAVTRPSTEVLGINLSPSNRKNVRGYVVEPGGHIVIYGETPESDLQKYSDLLRKDPVDETVGILNPAGFSPGTYTVTYTFLLHPRIQYDTTHTYLQFPVTGPSPYLLYSVYPLIESVDLQLQMDGIQAVYPSPSTLTVERSANGAVVVRGTMVDHPPVQVGILLAGSPVPEMTAFSDRVSDIQAKAASGEVPGTPLVDLSATAAALLKVPLALMVLGLPLLFLLLYLLRGREGYVRPVPDYLSFVPNPARKPWQVSFLFTGEPLQLDYPAYFSTILDLHRRGIIAITLPRKGEDPAGIPGFRIQFLDTQDLDPYEQAVVTYLKSISHGGGVVDPSLFRHGPPGDPKEMALREAQGALDRATLDIERAMVPRVFTAGPGFLISLGYGAILLWLATMLIVGFGPLVDYTLSGDPLVFLMCFLVIPAAAFVTFATFRCAGKRLMHRIRRLGECPFVTWGPELGMGVLGALPFLLIIELMIWNARIPPALAFTAAIIVILLVMGIPELYGTRREMYPPLSGQVLPAFVATIPAMVVIGWLLGLAVYSTPLAWETVAVAWFATVLLLQVAITLSFPVGLFGRWKEGLYREGLEWDAFRRFLVAFPEVDHAAPAELKKWNEWLVYGTALGMGKSMMLAYPALGDETLRMTFLPEVIEAHRPMVEADEGKRRPKVLHSRLASGDETWKELAKKYRE